MIYYIIKSIIPCALGWIGCEIYHRMTKEEELDWLTEWLSSFDTNSATKCFEAVNLLKERVEHEET